MSSWTTGTFETNEARANGLTRTTQAGGSSTPTLPVDQAYRATRHTASMANNAEDLAHLLDLLGLDPDMGKVHRNKEEAA